MATFVFTCLFRRSGRGAGYRRLGKARACAARGPGVWDAVPLKDAVPDTFEDALLRLKVMSFFECLALSIDFILGGDFGFPVVEGELRSRVSDISILGSTVLEDRLEDLLREVESALESWAVRKANLSREALKLYRQRWLDQKGVTAHLSEEISKMNSLREEALREVEAIKSRCLEGGGHDASSETLKPRLRIKFFNYTISENQRRLDELPSRPALQARALEEKEGELARLEDYIRRLAEPFS
jgi:hypothetical protein